MEGRLTEPSAGAPARAGSLDSSERWVARSAVSDAEWNELALASPDAWMFSLSEWQRAICRVPPWGLEDHSFAMRDEGRLIGAMPLQWRGDGALCSTAMGPAGPLVRGDCVGEKRKTILQALLNHARELAGDLGVERIEISIPVLSPSSLENARGVNPLVEFGYDDVSTHSWILDLRRPIADVEEGFSRNVRRKLRETDLKGYRVEPVQRRGQFDAYYEIHSETYRRTGARPHPKEYFLNIYDEFVATGRARAWMAVNSDGLPVAFTNIARFGKAALYWTACCRDEDYKNGVYYLLLASAIRAAHAEGAEWFDCAEAFPNAPADSKERHLSDFKRKFGGELRRYFKGRLRLREPSRTGAGIKDVLRSTRPTIAKLAGERFVRGAANAARKVLRGWRETVAPPIHFLKPVWEDSEKRIGFSEESAPRAKVFEQLEDGFRNLIQAQPVETVLFTDSARVAWELLLGVLRQKNPGRDEVILPSYGCRGTYDPIVANGLVPVFADIDERLLTPEEEILSLFSERTLAVLLVHLGGLRLDTSRIVDEARRRGIVTVEDYCQRTGPRPAGPRADASLFSFGMGKNLMATAGGAVLSSIHGADLRAAHAELAETPAEMARRRFAWRYAQFFEDAPPDASSRQIGATEELESYPRTAMSTLDAELMIEQIRRWKAIVIGRKAHAATLAALLGSPGCPIQAPPLQDHSCTKFSVLVDDRRRFAKFLQHLGSRGIDAELMYTPLHLRHFASGHLRRALPSSENLYPRVVNLPVRPNLSAREFFRVARALGDFIAGGGHA